MESPLKLLEASRRTGQPHIDALPDKSGAIISLPAAIPAQFQITLSEVESATTALGAVRAALLPAVPSRWTMGTIVKARETTVALEMNMMTGDALLHVRDAGFGWQHYIVTRAKAREFGLALIAFSEAPLPAAGNA